MGFSDLALRKLESLFNGKTITPEKKEKLKNEKEDLLRKQQDEAIRQALLGNKGNLSPDRIGELKERREKD